MDTIETVYKAPLQFESPLLDSRKIGVRSLIDRINSVSTSHKTFDTVLFNDGKNTEATVKKLISVTGKKKLTDTFNKEKFPKFTQFHPTCSSPTSFTNTDSLSKSTLVEPVLHMTPHEVAASSALAKLRYKALTLKNSPVKYTNLLTSKNEKIRELARAQFMLRVNITKMTDPLYLDEKRYIINYIEAIYNSDKTKNIPIFNPGKIIDLYYLKIEARTILKLSMGFVMHAPILEKNKDVSSSVLE